MASLVENLKLLNSKERYFLVGFALGNPEFSPSAAFIECLGRTFGMKIRTHPFVAMDYHLDWLTAALHRSVDPTAHIFPNTDACIEANQCDIDLILAFEDGSETHVLLLEAKGVTGWKNPQMHKKAARFTQIFGAGGDAWKKVIPHFAIVSPRKSKNLNVDSWPAWMAPDGVIPWIQLPGTEACFRVHRCDSRGKESKDGTFFTVAKR